MPHTRMHAPLLRYGLVCLLMALLPLRGFAAVAGAGCISLHTPAQSLAVHAGHPAGHALHAADAPVTPHAMPLCDKLSACCAAAALIATPLPPLGKAPHLSVRVADSITPASVPGTPLERPPRA